MVNDKFDPICMTVVLEHANETQLDIMCAAMMLASENAEVLCKDIGRPSSVTGQCSEFLKSMAAQLMSARDTLRGLPKFKGDCCIKQCIDLKKISSSTDT